MLRNIYSKIPKEFIRDKTVKENVTDKNFKFSEKVDVIFASLFFSALEGTAPFQRFSVIKKLKNFLKKDGVLIVVDFYWDELKESQDILCRKLWDLKDGLKTILGIPFPKQMPAEYLERLLELADYKILLKEKEGENRTRFGAKLKKYKERVENTKEYINKFENPELRKALNKYIDGLMTEIEKIGKPAHFASNYLIVARV